MITVRVSMNVLPQKQREVMQTFFSMIESTRKEPGCLSYSVFRDIEDKSLFSLFEEWETREDLDHHIRSHGFSAFLGINTLLSEPPKIQIYTLSQPEGMEAIHAIRGKRS